MILDDRYLEVQGTDDVRVRGSRVGIEHVISAYLAGNVPEQIALEYPTLTLEQIHGLIAWYLRNRQEVDAYLARWQAHAREARSAQAEGDQAEVIQRLRRLAEERVLG